MPDTFLTTIVIRWSTYIKYTYGSCRGRSEKTGCGHISDKIGKNYSVFYWMIEYSLVSFVFQFLVVLDQLKVEGQTRNSIRLFCS